MLEGGRVAHVKILLIIRRVVVSKYLACGLTATAAGLLLLLQ